ncbi:RTA1 like protein-domain-containing protein [Thermoascus aurantiacus ATCC 26904]
MSSSSTSNHGGWVAYEYYPSMAAAVIFIILFISTTLLHTYHLLRTRTWFFIPLVIGGYFESVGYIGRAMSAHQSPNWTLGPYVMQSTLLLIAPALFAASIYMELGRIIILVHAEQYSLVRVNWLTKIFVTGDVLSFLMQASGAGLMVKDASTMGTGRNVIIAGLFVQIVFFCFFLCSALVFQSRISKYPTSQSEAPYIPWRKHMYALHASSLLILIRSVFRVIEYIEGQDGFLMHNEVFLYMFDALLMFLVMVVFIVIHPSEINCLLGKGTLMTQRGGLSLSEFTVGV